MRRYPLRTIIMMLGSFVGVALLMFVLSVGRGAQTLMLRTVRQILGDQAILVMAGGGTMMGGPRGGSARLTIDDLDAVGARGTADRLLGPGRPELWRLGETRQRRRRRRACSANRSVGRKCGDVVYRAARISTHRPSPARRASR
jgi:hypothetical protein